MKKIVLIAFLYLLLLPVLSLATVGGPTYITDIKYKADEETVYYSRHDLGGRGCPPEIISLDSRTGEKRTVLSCEDGEHDYEGQINTVQQYLSELDGVPSINLKKNKITAQIDVVKETPYDEDSEVYVGSTDFIISIFQNGDKKGSFNFGGCSRNQPHIVEGYRIPVRGKLLILISRKGDCFEGGYIKEDIFLANEIEILDESIVGWKSPGPTTVNEGNLVLFAGDIENNANNIEVGDLELRRVILVAGALLIFSFILGYTVKGKRKLTEGIAKKNL